MSIHPNELNTEHCKLINLSELLKVVPLSRTGVYDRMNPRSKYYDPTFPKPIHISTRKRCWVYEEVTTWLENLKQNRQSYLQHKDI